MNSTSFGESVFIGGFIQKTIKEDLFVKGNLVNPRRYLHGKTLEDSRRQITKADPEPLTCGAGGPHLQAGQPVSPTSQPFLHTLISHRLQDYIYAILSSQFDPRVQI